MRVKPATTADAPGATVETLLAPRPSMIVVRAPALWLPPKPTPKIDVVAQHQRAERELVDAGRELHELAGLVSATAIASRSVQSFAHSPSLPSFVVSTTTLPNVPAGRPYRA